jgi:tetratricopeptide (TPR) repeat protein
MLAEKNERAIELGTEALRLAEELGLEDLRASALINIGTARGHIGDPRGFADLEESIAIASRINSAAEIIRATNNLAAVTHVQGDIPKAREIWNEARRLSNHFGHYGFARFLEGGPMIGFACYAGEWDDALQRADAFLAEVESGSPHYQAAAAYMWRGFIRLARGDSAGAQSDAARAVEVARPIGDPQRLLTALPRAAFVFLSAGGERRAEELLDESLQRLRELTHFGYGGVDIHLLAWVALAHEREADVLAVIERESFQSLWVQAGRAVVARQFRDAADTLEQIGDLPYEAFYRLRAAEHLVADGRRAEADEQLNRALAFYRRVGATRYVREGEALLAASA